MKKIVLLCSAGMSTSILVKKMQEAAAAVSYECSIAAYPIAEAHKMAADADVILLGPQVRFFQSKVADQCPGVPITAIETKIYGRMDGAAVLNCARQMMAD